MNEKELDDRLLNEIIQYFELPEDEKRRLCKFSRSVVEANYSAEKMALETLGFYERILKRYQNSNKIGKTSSFVGNIPMTKRDPRVAICGYYGHGNLGDEAILQAISSKIIEISPQAKLCPVNSKSPIKILKSLLDVDLFLFGGGSLLQNSTSNASLFYYLALIGIASLTCKHKIMIANGIGPIKTRGVPRALLLKVIANTVDSFDLITVRDMNSKIFLQKLLPHRKIHILPDLALMDLEKNSNDIDQSTRICRFSPTNLPYYIYVPCSFGLKGANITPERVAKDLLALEKRFDARVVIAVMNKNEDMCLAKEILSYISREKEKREILCPKNADELLSLLKNARFVVSQRYHGALFGVFSGAITIPVSNDNKMKALGVEIWKTPCQAPDIFENEERLLLHIASEISRQSTMKNEIRHKIKKLSTSSCEGVDKILKKYL